MHGDLKHIRQCTMDVVRYLLWSIESQSSRRVPVGDNGMWLSETVIGTGKEPIRSVASSSILSHPLNIAKLLENPLLDIG